jgi:hypothetical protein
MGKRTLKRKRKRKTLRGGDIRIRDVLRNIQLQVDGEEVDGDHENGFYGRLYTLIEDEHMTNLAVGTILDQQLHDMVSSLEEFVGMIHEANDANAERTLDYMRTLRNRIMTTLEDMLNIAQGMDELARPISNHLLDEIRTEIRFIRERFNTLALD